MMMAAPAGGSSPGGDARATSAKIGADCDCGVQAVCTARVMGDTLRVVILMSGGDT